MEYDNKQNNKQDGGKNRNIDFDHTIVISTETTGLNCNRDELLQVAITDAFGNELFNEYMKPMYIQAWPKAQMINGISPEMVADKRTFCEYGDEIRKIIRRAKTIVGYNIDFDESFIASFRWDTKIYHLNRKVDLMDRLRIYKEKLSGSGYYRWQKLEKCASYYGYEWEGSVHDALEDCRATAFCFRKMCGKE